MVLLKRWENLTEKQEAKLKDLLQYNLRSVRASLLKEDFDGFWDYVSPAWAGKFLDRWCTRVMRSRIEPMKNGGEDNPQSQAAHPQLVQGGNSK
jgi:transposase